MAVCPKPGISVLMNLLLSKENICMARVVVVILWS